MPHYIDAHSHLADSRLDLTRDDVMERARARGIEFHIQGGVGPEDWDQQVEISESYPGQIFPVFGLHPWWVVQHDQQVCESALGFLRNYLKSGVGLGELGLDYGPKIPSGSHALQKMIFEYQLKMAREFALPIILHVVHAHDDALAMLTQFGVPKGGIVHSFSETTEIAQRYLALGLTLSISGSVITRDSGKAFEKLKRTVLALGLDQIVIETDSPDQPPAGVSGHGAVLNEPANLWSVAEAVGRLKQVSAEVVLEASKKNLVRIFGLGVS